MKVPLKRVNITILWGSKNQQVSLFTQFPQSKSLSVRALIGKNLCTYAYKASAFWVPGLLMLTQLVQNLIRSHFVLIVSQRRHLGQTLPLINNAAGYCCHLCQMQSNSSNTLPFCVIFMIICIVCFSKLHICVCFKKILEICMHHSWKWTSDRTSIGLFCLRVQKSKIR